MSQNFCMKLHSEYFLDKNIEILKIPYLDEDLHDIDSLLIYLCEVIENLNFVEFIVCGFGQDKWPLDISVDLSSVLVQLSDIALAIGEKDNFFELDFFGQGIQRRINFERKEQFFTVNCLSGTNWIPNPGNIILSEQNIVLQVLNLTEDFTRYACSIFPSLSKYKLFKDWYGYINLHLKDNF